MVHRQIFNGESMTYILVDTANTFFRARHAVRGDADMKIGMALHTTFQSIRKAWQDFNGSHVVFCLEGRSWRKDFYEPYKKNRAVARAALTEKEQEEEQLFWETFDEFTKYLRERTNCSVLRHENAEADDLIARWIDLHKDDEHTIISSDTDFVQLIANNVQQYNGITDELITHEGIFNSKGDRVLDKKTKEPKAIPDPEWLLLRSACEATVVTMCFQRIQVYARKAQRTRLACWKRLRIVAQKDTIGTI